MTKEKKKAEQKQCVARDPLRYGSRQCERPRAVNWDLCREHGEALRPYAQLINGVLYVSAGDEL